MLDNTQREYIKKLQTVASKVGELASQLQLTRYFISVLDYDHHDRIYKE